LKEAKQFWRLFSLYIAYLRYVMNLPESLSVIHASIDDSTHVKYLSYPATIGSAILSTLLFSVLIISKASLSSQNSNRYIKVG